MKSFLVPPHKYEKTGGTWAVADVVYVCSPRHEDDAAARVVLSALSQMGSLGRLPGRLVGNAVVSESQRVNLIRDKQITDPEGFRITVRSEGVDIFASTPAGTYYGAQTLAEYIEYHGRRLPCCNIEDAPDLRRRGFSLDCSRGKVPTVETLKQLIRRLARWKINELQLYVENVFTFARHPAIGQGFSPFTPEDILELGAHCARHHIAFVPSLASLGHFEKILMLDAYKGLGEQPGGTTLCPTDPESVKLIGDLYDEYLPLFRSDDFNACGDEPWGLGAGRSKAEADKKGAGRVFLDFILDLYDLSLGHGKRMNMWGDFPLKHQEIISGIPSDMVILNWDYTPGGEMMGQTGKFSEAGLPIVCCPSTNSWQSHGTRIDKAMKNIDEFAAIAVSHGAEGLLNTDWGDYGHRNPLGVSLVAAAYGGAHAWNHQATTGISKTDFIRSFCLHTFGDLDGLVDQYVLATGDDRYETWAYHCLMESIFEPTSHGRGFCQGKPVIAAVKLSKKKTDDMRGAATKLGGGAACLDAFDAQYGEERRFERIALEEYVLANRMNLAALNRLELSGAIRSGKKPGKKKLTDHERELFEIRDDFQRLWLLRSRVSRLEDNLAGFDAVIAEVRGRIDGK
ncbi:MAG: family 20 glycosylhydrolase [Spirochaetales bacterium]|nr:family 20 glycosylhydrolase [Spirochaetales bacterium]